VDGGEVVGDESQLLDHLLDIVVGGSFARRVVEFTESGIECDGVDLWGEWHRSDQAS
jgi:hypothetical protein